MDSELVASVHLVGRQRELADLRARLADASRGAGSLTMLVGEAGIGKTRVAREFATSAQSRGAVVLWGGCYEGDWSPPYGPWVEALGGYARAVAPDLLLRQLGTGAPSLSQLVPEIRAALPDVPSAPPLILEEERYRLYDAVAQFLVAAAREQPIVLVLDDLHWADRDSLRLLRHVARFADGASLLIVGAYRDAELDMDPQHPLGDLLAVLHRETPYGRLALTGLSPAEVAQYLAQAARNELPQVLVSAVYAETAGNPFYVREVLRHLVEEGKIIRRDGRWSTDFSIGELGIPEGVRRIVRRRVSRLSADASRMLRIAAAFTSGFDSRVLQALTGLTEDALLDSIDETLRAGFVRVLDSCAATYDFAHAIVRHTIYEELNPDRRARLHRRIASFLEQVYADRVADHAAEIAAQYHASARLPGAQGGIRHCLVAAEQARAVHARERAVAFLRMARELEAGEEPSERGPVLSALAIAEAEALMLDAAQGTIEEALAALGQQGADATVLARFLAEVAQALKDGGASHAVWEPLVERGLALAGDRRDLVWARLMLLRDRLEAVSSGPITAGRWLGQDPVAVAIARTSGDEYDYARTLQPFDWRAREETEGVYALSRVWRRPVAVMRALDVAARDHIYRQGEIAAAVDRLHELLALSERVGSIPAQVEALAQLALCRAILGDLSLAQDVLRRAQEAVARLGTVHRLHVVVTTAVPSVLAYFVGGDWPALARAATDFVAFPLTSRGPLGLTAASFATYDHNRAGNEAEARRLLAAITPLFERLGPATYIYNGSLDRTATAVWEMGAVEYAAHYRSLALDLLARGEEGSPLRSNALTVARMAALLGDAAEARAYFARARHVLDEAGQRPLRAIVELDEAEALFRSGPADDDRATALSDGALARFTALGMDDWSRRAGAQRERIASRRRPVALTKHSYPGGLTAREVDVVRLIAAGKTNKEIAAELVVSVPTVQRHIANIYAKIGARGRADATAYALTRGLAPARVS